jgi:hypothetical protein
MPKSVALACTWERSVAAADAPNQSEDLNQTTLFATRFSFARILPRTRAHPLAMQPSADSVFAKPDKLFGRVGRDNARIAI